jgi:hypothetical protein
LRANLKLVILILISISSYTTRSYSYDEVKVDKIIPIADRKSSITKLRTDGHNGLWILNETSKSIQLISSDGHPSVNLTSGKKGLFKEPVDFDFLSNGSMAVLDGGSKKIVILSPTEDQWDKARIQYQISIPDAVSITVSHEDIIAVGYSGQNGIDLFSIDGVLLHRLIAPEKQALKTIGNLNFSNDGTLWALDSDREVLHRFSPERKWLGAVENLEGAQFFDVDEHRMVQVQSVVIYYLDFIGVFLVNIGIRKKLPRYKKYT